MYNFEGAVRVALERVSLAAAALDFIQGVIERRMTMDALQLARFEEASRQCSTFYLWLGIRQGVAPKDLFGEDVGRFALKIVDTFLEWNDNIIVATPGTTVCECEAWAGGKLFGSTSHEVASQLLMPLIAFFEDDSGQRTPAIEVDEPLNQDALARLDCQMRRERTFVQAKFGEVLGTFTVSRFEEMVDLERDAIRSLIRKAGLPVAERGKCVAYSSVEAVRFLRAAVANCRSKDSRRKAGEWLAKLDRH